MHHWDGEGAFGRDGIRQGPIDIVCIMYSSRKKKFSPKRLSLRNMFQFVNASFN